MCNLPGFRQLCYLTLHSSMADSPGFMSRGGDRKQVYFRNGIWILRNLRRGRVEEPLACAHSRKPRSMFLCMSACVYVCACTYLCACVYVHKGRNTGSLWPQQRHLGAGRASPLGSSEQVHTPCVLVYTLLCLVYTDLQQRFLATGALSDSTPSPALR